MSVKLKVMKTVTLRALRREALPAQLAHSGEELLVTKHGRPYLRVLPPERPDTFLGACKAGKPLTKAILGPAVAPEEWEALS